MNDRLNENNELVFEETVYDMDGLIRLVDSEEAAMVFMYYDVEDDKYYRNRYDVLECERGINNILARTERYLEQDETNGLFIAYAAAHEGRVSLLDGSIAKEEDLNLGELELGPGLVYGMLIRKQDEMYLFSEVLYHDGGEISGSWATVIEDAGVLTPVLHKLIMQFAD